jgi:hypothetical protein
MPWEDDESVPQHISPQKEKVMFETRTTPVDRTVKKTASILEATPSSAPSKEKLTVTEGEDRFTPAAIQMFLGRLAE